MIENKDKKVIIQTSGSKYCKAPLLFAIRFNLIYILITLVLFQVFYLTPDDLYMQCQASGLEIAHSPSEHLLFSNVLIGLALKGLYSLAPNVDWYPAYLLASLFLSFVVLAYCFFRRFPWKLALGLYSIFYFVIGWVLIVRLHFTLVAAAVCLSGLVLFLTTLAEKSCIRFRDLLLPLLLCFLGGLIRPLILYLIGFVMVPWALYITFPSKRRVVFAVLFACLALGLGKGGSYYNAYYYAQSPGWEDYYSTKANLRPLVDFDRISASALSDEILEKVAMTRLDVFLICDWYFEDRELLAKDKLELLLAEGRKSNEFFSLEAHRAAGAVLISSFQGFIKILTGSLVAMLALGFVFQLRKGGRTWILFGLLLVWGVLTAYALTFYFNRMTPSVLSSILLVILVVMLFEVRELRSYWHCCLLKIPKKSRITLSLLVVISLLYLSYFQFLKGDLVRSVLATQLLQSIEKREKSPDELIVMIGDSIPFEVIAPFGGVRALFNQIPTLHINNDFTLGPNYLELKEKFGIKELGRSLFERENLYIWETRQPKRKQAYKNMIKERYGVDVRTEVIAEPKFLNKPILFQYVKVGDKVEK